MADQKITVELAIDARGATVGAAEIIQATRRGQAAVDSFVAAYRKIGDAAASGAAVLVPSIGKIRSELGKLQSAADPIGAAYARQAKAIQNATVVAGNAVNERVISEIAGARLIAGATTAANDKLRADMEAHYSRMFATQVQRDNEAIAEAQRAAKEIQRIKEEAAKRMADTQGRVETARSQADPIFGADRSRQQTLANMKSDLADLVMAGKMSMDDASRHFASVRDSANKKYGDVIEAQIRSITEPQIRAAKEAKKAANDAKKELIDAQSRFSGSIAAVDPIFAVKQTREAAIRNMTQDAQTLVNAGKMDSGDAAAKLQQVEQHYNKVLQTMEATGRAGKLSRYELINLSRQFQDVGVSLSSGQSVFTVLIQQGTQIADVFAASNSTIIGGIKQVLGWFTPLKVAVIGVTTAVITGAAAWFKYDDSIRTLNASLTGLGRGAGVTADALERIAQNTAKRTTMTIGESRETVGTLASTGAIAPELLGSLSVQAKNYALQTNQDVAAATKELASAFADPVKGLELLREKLGGVNASQIEFVRHSVAVGNTAAAQGVMMTVLAEATSKAAEKVSGLTHVWEGFLKVVTGASDAVGKAVQQQIFGTVTRQEQIESLKIDIESAIMRLMPVTLARKKRELGALRVEEADDFFRRDAAAVEEAARMKSDRMSLPAAAAARGFVPEVMERKLLEDAIDLLTNIDAEGLKKLGLTAEQATEAFNRAGNKLDFLKTVSERIAEDSQLQVAGILARTLAEKAYVASMQAALPIMRDTGNVVQANAAAEAARNQVLAEAARKARDMQRDATDNLALAGLRPYDRARQQILIEGRKAMEELTGQDNSLKAQLTTVNTDMATRIVDANTRFLTHLEAILNRALIGGSGVGVSGGLGSVSPFVRAGATADSGDPLRSTLAASTASPIPGLHADFASKLQEFIRAVNGVSITSGFRTNAQQQVLYDRYLRGEGPIAAPPGSSNHNFGVAADLRFASPAARQEAHRRAPDFGLRFPMSYEPWHIEPNNARAMRGGIGTAETAARVQDTVRKNFGALDKETATGPIREANDALNAQIKLLDRQRDSFGASTAEIARASEEQRLLNEYTKIFGENPIPQTVRDAITDYANRAGEAAQKQRQLAIEQENVKRAIGDLQGAFGDAFKGFLSDLRAGKSASEAFRNSLERIAERLTSMAADMVIRNLFQGMFGTLAQGSGNSLISPSFLTRIFGGGGGGTFMGSSGLAGSTGLLFHRGGIVGEEGQRRHSMPIAAFANAPRFHGGFMPSEYPAILQRGEGVFTRGQMRNMAPAANVNVKFESNVVNNTSGRVTTRERDDGQGGRVIEHTIDEMVAGTVASGGRGNRTGQALAARGARPPRTRY